MSPLRTEPRWRRHPLFIQAIEPGDLGQSLPVLFAGRPPLVISQGHQTDDLELPRNTKELPGSAGVEPADPARSQAELFGLEGEVLPGDADVDEIEGDVLDLLADVVGQEVRPGKDDDEHRRFGGKPGE